MPPEAHSFSNAMWSQDIIRKGMLGIQRRKGTDPKYFVLYKDRFDHFDREEDIALDSEPRGRIRLEDVQGVETLDLGIVLRLGGQNNDFSLSGLDGEDVRPWADDISALIRKLKSGPMKAATVQLGCTAFSMGHTESSMGQPQNRGGGVVCEGILDLVKKDKAEPRHLVLFPSHFEYYNTKKEFEGGDKPRCRVTLASVTNVDITDEIALVVHVDDRSFRFHVGSHPDSEMRRWGVAWSEVLAAHGSNATVRWGQTWTNGGNAQTGSHSSPGLGDAEDVLHQGTLHVGSSGNALRETRCLIQKSCMILDDTESQQSRKFSRNDIFDVEVVDEGFNLQLRAGDPLMLRMDPAELETWLAALESMLEDSHDAEQQHQTPPQPRALCRGPLLATWGESRGRTEEENEEMFAIFEDRLESITRGVQLMVADMHDVEVTDSDCVIHTRGNPWLRLRAPGGAEELERWLEVLEKVQEDDERRRQTMQAQQQSAQSPRYPETTNSSQPRLSRTKSDLAAGPTRCIHEGAIEGQPVGPNQRRPRHGVLYGTKLELFLSFEDAENGAPPVESFDFEAINDVLLHDSCVDLIIEDNGREQLYRMGVRGKVEFQEWSVAFRKALGGRKEFARLAESHWARNAAPAPPPRRRMSGEWSKGSAAAAAMTRAGMIHQGPIAVVTHGQQARRQHLVIYRDRLEYYDDVASARSGSNCCGEISPGDVREVRVLESGFVLGLEHDNVEFRVPSGEDTEVWAQALRRLLDPGEEEGGSLPSTPSAPQLPESDPRVEAWLRKLRERPVCHGSLGFQEKGKLSTRFCVLFRDRLDFWDSASSAIKGKTPHDCLVFNGVRGLEIVKGGFVLNNKGRRIGVHVSSNEQLHEWSGALLSVFAPSKGNDPNLSKPLERKAWGNFRASSPDGHGNAPRVGTLSPGPASPRVASPRAPRISHLVAPKRTSPGRNTLPSNSTMKIFTRDDRRGVVVHNPQQRETGGGWMNRNIASKINERTPDGGLSPRSRDPGFSGEKITGTTVSRPASPRVTSPDRSPAAGKITDCVRSGPAKPTTAGQGVGKNPPSFSFASPTRR